MGSSMVLFKELTPGKVLLQPRLESLILLLFPLPVTHSSFLSSRDGLKAADAASGSQNHNNGLGLKGP